MIKQFQCALYFTIMENISKYCMTYGGKCLKINGGKWGINKSLMKITVEYSMVED